MNQRRIYFLKVFVLLALTFRGTQALSMFTCEQLFAKIDMRKSESAVVDQMAKLRQLINESSEPSLKLRLLADFDQKLNELSQGNSKTQSRWVQKIRERMSELENQKTLSKDDQIEARKTQTKEIQNWIPKLNKVIETDLLAKEIHTLDDTYVRNSTSGNLFGSGVMWSADEKFVVLRSFQAINQGSPSGSQIYDVDRRELLPFNPRGGVLSEVGSKYAEFKNDHTIITDLRTLQKVAELPGELTGNEGFFNDDFTILKTQNDAQKSIFTLHDNRGGRRELGEFFGYSETVDRFAYFENGKVKLFDFKTGQFLKVPAALANAVPSSQTAYRQGYFIFLLGNEPHLMFMDDLSVHKAPLGNAYLRLIPGTHIVYQTVRKKNKGTVVLNDLTSGKSLSVAGDEVRIDPKSKHIAIPSYGGDSMTIVDLKTWKSHKAKGDFDYFIGGGPWLIGEERRGHDEPLHHIYNVETREAYQVPFRGKFKPLPGSDFWIMDSSEKKFSALTSPTNFLDVLEPIGESTHRTGISPSGRYLVTVAGGKVVILSTRESRP